ncbi:MAG: hypothetical protein AB8B91_12200, partial [Rubripirellula sp.]
FSAENVEIRGGAGSDNFISDDSMAAMYVYGDSGNDNFLIGRVLKTKTATIDGVKVDVVDGLDGASPGVSFNGYFYGGTGNDYFEVNHNVGELDLFGEAGDDTFFLKALLQETGQELVGGEILAGAGDEQGNLEESDNDTLIDYIENNRVDIFGGSGFDTVVVAGTAGPDEFFIYNDNDGRQYLYGSGLKMENIVGIERLALVTGGGDDIVHLYGLNEELSLILNLGSGDDLLRVGGDEDTVEVTYPASSAIHSVEHDVVEDVLDPANPEIRTLNQVEFVKRDLTLPDKQLAFKEFYKKWVEPKDVAISDRHWQLLETNFVIALKLFAQAIDKADGPSPIVTLNYDAAVAPASQNTPEEDEQAFIDRVNQLEAALQSQNAGKWRAGGALPDYELRFLDGGPSPLLPNKVDFDTLLGLIPGAGFSANNRSVDFILFKEYLRLIVARTIQGDFVHSDQVREGTAFNSPRVDGWGYEPDLYYGDLYTNQVSALRQIVWRVRHRRWWGGSYTHNHVYNYREYMQHISGAGDDVWIPMELYPNASQTSGKGAELYQDLISLFYDVQAPHPQSEINVTQFFKGELVPGSAAYRFDLPERTVEKILPANFDLSKIAGTVRLAGGLGDDTIEVNARKEGGFNAELKTQTLNLADYIFDEEVTLDNAPVEPADPTAEEQAAFEIATREFHDEVQAALVREDKGSQVGVLKTLVDSADASLVRTVPISRDTTEHTFQLGEVLVDLKNESDDLIAAIQSASELPNANTLVLTEQLAFANRAERFATRGRQLIGATDDVSGATFSMDALEALMNGPVFRAMLVDGNADAVALETELVNVKEFITLVSVNRSLQQQGYSWSGDGALQVYSQNDSGLEDRTVKYEYSQDVWEQRELDEANLYQRKSGEFEQRLDVFTPEQEDIVDFGPNDPNNASKTRSLREITFNVGGNTLTATGLSADAVGNQVEMEKVYVAKLSELDTSYYTYSFYGVDGGGDRVLEAVAIRRLGGAEVDGADAIGPDRYLTQDNWDDYVKHIAVGQPQLEGAADNGITDQMVRDLIATAFNQTRRVYPDEVIPPGTNPPMVTPVIRDGILLDHADLDSPDSVNVDAIQDDAGFYLPETVTVLRTTITQQPVPADYVVDDIDETKFDVVFERLTEEVPSDGGSQDAGDAHPEFVYDLWFSSFETVNLDLNAAGTPHDTEADILTVDGTYYVGQLNVDIGHGDNLVNVSGLNASTLITTGDGSDKFNIHSLSNSTFDTESLDVSTITPGDPDADPPVPAVYNDRVIVNAGLGDDQFFLNYHPTTSWNEKPVQSLTNGIL